MCAISWVVIYIHRRRMRKRRRKKICVMCTGSFAYCNYLEEMRRVEEKTERN